jgi:hypothetical protein
VAALNGGHNGYTTLNRVTNVESWKRYDASLDAEPGNCRMKAENWRV